jgi:hypothetical protein
VGLERAKSKEPEEDVLARLPSDGSGGDGELDDVVGEDGGGRDVEDGVIEGEYGEAIRSGREEQDDRCDHVRANEPSADILNVLRSPQLGRDRISSSSEGESTHSLSRVWYPCQNIAPTKKMAMMMWTQ